MYNTLGIKSDYSILKSLIKIPDLVSFCMENNINYVGLVDDNLFGSIELYDLCIKNNIKPIIGFILFFLHKSYSSIEPNKLSSIIPM